MAKRSHRRPNRHLDRAQGGCIWGLISIFDVRHGRSTKRLLSVRKRAVGSRCSNAQKALLNWTGKCGNVLMPMADAAKTSVKDLMEVEIFNEPSSMDHQPTDSKPKSEQISSKCPNNAKNKRRNRSCIKSSDAKGCSPRLEHKASDDLERILEELSKIIRTDIENWAKTDVHGDLDVPRGKAVTVGKKLAATIELVIEEKLSNSKHLEGEDNAVYCKDFVDALQALSLNKCVLETTAGSEFCIG